MFWSNHCLISCRDVKEVLEAVHSQTFPFISQIIYKPFSTSLDFQHDYKTLWAEQYLLFLYVIWSTSFRDPVLCHIACFWKSCLLCHVKILVHWGAPSYSHQTGFGNTLTLSLLSQLPSPSLPFLLLGQIWWNPNYATVWFLCLMRAGHLCCPSVW